jgi:glutaredoxin
MPIKIEVFTSPGCGKCGRAKEAMLTLVLELGEGVVRGHEVNMLEELDHAVALGVVAAPAISIDGELVFTRLPSARRLRQTLEGRLKEAPA